MNVLCYTVPLHYCGKIFGVVQTVKMDSSDQVGCFDACCGTVSFTRRDIRIILI